MRAITLSQARWISASPRLQTSLLKKLLPPKMATVFHVGQRAGEGNRTLVAGLGSQCITTMLRPHALHFPILM